MRILVCAILALSSLAMFGCDDSSKKAVPDKKAAATATAPAKAAPAPAKTAAPGGGW